MQEGESSRERPVEEFKETSISKIAGEDSFEREKVSKEHQKEFENQDEKFFYDIPLKDIEREKSEGEKEVIDFILAKMPEFVRKNGGTPAPVEQKHIHLLEKAKLLEDLLEDTDERGFFKNKHEYIGVYDSANLLELAHSVTHELLHFNGFISVNAPYTNYEMPRSLAEPRRTGISMDPAEVDGSDDDSEFSENYFDWLNEAITEELTKRFDAEYLEASPILEDLINEREVKKRLFKAKNPGAKTKIDDVAFFLEGGKHSTYGYEDERADMYLFLNDLYDKNKDRFKNSEEVFQLLVKGYMSGEVLDLARIVEKTYGKGSFRKLGAGIDELI